MIMKKLLTILICLLLVPFALAQEDVEDGGVTPDQPLLWALDKALERVELALTFDMSKKASKRLENARERLLEVRDMIEEDKLEDAEKARESHDEELAKVKGEIDRIEADGSLDDLEDLIVLDEELQEHEEIVERTFDELKLRIDLEGEITPQQKALIDMVLENFKGDVGDIRIKIENREDETKLKIKIVTGQSDDELEGEVEGIRDDVEERRKKSSEKDDSKD